MRKSLMFINLFMVVLNFTLATYHSFANPMTLDKLAGIVEHCSLGIVFLIFYAVIVLKKVEDK